MPATALPYAGMRPDNCHLDQRERSPDIVTLFMNGDYLHNKHKAEDVRLKTRRTL
jgi:hypothetical protein